MAGPPSTNRPNGRDARGRFTKGNPGGPGNPHVAAVAKWRTALVETVTAADLRRVIRKLVESAEAGEPWAIRELLDRTLGRPTQPPEPSVPPHQEITRPNAIADFKWLRDFGPGPQSPPAGPGSSQERQGKPGKK